MKNLPFFLSILPFFIFPKTALAGLVKPATCQQALIGQLQAPLKKRLPPWPQTVWISRFRDVQKSEPGGFFKLRSKSDNSWNSNFNRTGFDFQGSPDVVLKVLGPVLARFLGIELISPNEMIIPDHITLNHRIEALNVRLQKLGYEPIPLRFFISEKMSAKTFNSRFVDAREIPYNEIIHDFTYHTFSLVLTESFLKAPELRYNVFREFENQSRHSPETLALFTEHEELNVFFRMVEKIFASEIDVVTGGIYNRLGTDSDESIWNGYRATLEVGRAYSGILTRNEMLVEDIPKIYMDSVFKFLRTNTNRLYIDLFNVSSPSDRMILTRLENENLAVHQKLVDKLVKNFKKSLKKNPGQFPKYVVKRSLMDGLPEGVASPDNIGEKMEERLRQLQEASALID